MFNQRTRYHSTLWVPLRHIHQVLLTLHMDTFVWGRQFFTSTHSPDFISSPHQQFDTFSKCHQFSSSKQSPGFVDLHIQAFIKCYQFSTSNVRHVHQVSPVLHMHTFAKCRQFSTSTVRHVHQVSSISTSTHSTGFVSYPFHEFNIDTMTFHCHH